MHWHWIKRMLNKKYVLFIFDGWSNMKQQPIDKLRINTQLCTLGCLYDLRMYLSEWMHECVFLCIIRGLSIGGALRARSIVVVPCPLPGDIHHRGAPDFSLPPHCNPQGKALMRTKSPHQSGPYGDHLQYSTEAGPNTPAPTEQNHV